MGWGSDLVQSIAGTTASGLFLLALAVTVEAIAPRARVPMVSRLRGLAFMLIPGLLLAGPLHYVLVKLTNSVELKPLIELRLDRAFGWAGWGAPVLEIIAALLVLDLFHYAYHRIQHAALWRLHGLHHCVEDLHAATNYGHFLEEPFRLALLIVPFSFVEIHRVVEPVFIPLLLAWKEAYIHSPTSANFGPLRYFLVDNVYHRIHHSKDPAHFGKNFGIITPLWDVVFGTAYFPKPNEWPDTGVEGLPEPKSLSEYLLFPLRGLRVLRTARPAQASGSS